MQISSPRLRRLDNALAALPPESDAMPLSALDGYVTALALCPEAIAPDEWLPWVWDSDGGEAPFADQREARWYCDQVIEHRDAVARTLDKGYGHFKPFFEVDTRHDEVVWELWIEGFEMGMRLRPKSWIPLAESDEKAATAIAALITLAQIARDESDLERDAIDSLTEQAPTAIQLTVEMLNLLRLAEVDDLAAPDQSAAPAKIGRNDPCPCGSGKKYKKCCAMG